MVPTRLPTARVRPVRLPLLLLVTVAALAIALPVLGAAATTQTWRASVGASGTNGTATITASGSTGTLRLALRGLSRSTAYPVRIVKGTCAAPGSTLWAVPTQTATAAGRIAKSLVVPAARLAAIRAGAAGGAIAIRIGSGSRLRCGPLVLVGPAPTPTRSPDPVGWKRVTSQWLGYSIALPADRWVFYGHVDASGSQGAYDTFLGKVSPGGADMMLAIWSWPLDAGEAVPSYPADVIADGVPFAVSPAPESEGGGTTFFAKGIKGRTVWTLMADTAKERAAWDFFRQVVSTFRLPSPTFVEPTPKPYEPDDPASSRPVLVGSLPPAVRIAVGDYFVCAVTDTGGVRCWGGNRYGQLGDGTTEDRAAPVDVTGLARGITEVAAHVSHVCALTSDGEVKCWGSNHDGELGDGTTEDRTRPVAVSGLGGKAVAVAVGAFHTCALMASGGVKCWGSNDDGQLGDGTTEDSANPVDVVGLKTGVVAIAAAFGSSCAVMITGGVKCWGDNYWGQLGDGTTEDSAMPVDVVGLKAGVTAISGSADTMCAISRSGGVWCWGNNEFGTLGNGTTISSSTPVDVTGLGSGVTAIAVGSHACAVIKGGGVRCWGYNHYGELGDGTWTDSSVPVDVVGLDTRATAIGAHYYNSCALLSDGKVMCWGDDSQGQLGRGAVSGSAPSDTSAFPPSTGTHQVDADSD